MCQTEKGDNSIEHLVHSIIRSEIDLCVMFVTTAEKAYQTRETDRGKETAAKAEEIYERTIKFVEQANVDTQQKWSADLDRLRRSLDRLLLRS